MNFEEYEKQLFHTYAEFAETVQYILENALQTLGSLPQTGSGKVGDEEVFFRQALEYLTKERDARWVREAWFLNRTSKFFDFLNDERIALLLENLNYWPKINYQVERILGRIAEHRLQDVWEFLGRRFEREQDAKADSEFEAAPFKFHGLEKQLSKNAELAIELGRKWFTHDGRLFRFKRGRLISNAFPNCPQELADALVKLIETQDASAADFALEILDNYQGERTTHEVLKLIVERHANDAGKMSRVRISLDNIGMVSGEFGYAEALRGKKTMMTEWLTDMRPAVIAFAQKHIAELDLWIADEQRRAESRSEMRKLDFENDDNDHETDDDEPEPHN